MLSIGRGQAARVALFISTCANLTIAQLGDTATHPDWDLKPIAMPANYFGTGMAFLPDGRMVFTTGYLEQDRTIPGDQARVFVASDISGATPAVNLLAGNFINPSGVVVVEGKIYVADRDGFYQITSDTDYANPLANRTKLFAWPFGVFGKQNVSTPVYKDGFFYAPYSGSLKADGTSDAAATSDYSGAFLKWNLAGTFTKVSGGLRSPGGAGMDPDGNIFVTDVRGSWMPASTFNFMKDGKFYGHKQTSPNAPNWAETLPYQNPTAWLPEEAVSSPTQPLYLPKGPFKGQWIVGDLNGRGLSRIAMDTVDGEYQAAVLKFSNGTDSAAINRLALGPDGAVYIQTLGKIGNPAGNTAMPMYRMAMKPGVLGSSGALPQVAFDLRRFQSVSDGYVLYFTDNADRGAAFRIKYQVRQWGYDRVAGFGEGKSAVENISNIGHSTVVNWPGDFFGFRNADLVEGKVTHITVTGNLFQAQSSMPPFVNEIWYTHFKKGADLLPGAASIHGSPERSGWGSKVSLSAEKGSRLRVDLGIAGPYAVEIHNLNGSLAARKAGQGVLSLAAGRPGIYLVSVRCAQGSFTRKMAL